MIYFKSIGLEKAHSKDSAVLVSMSPTRIHI